jgi:protein SCO1/2
MLNRRQYLATTATGVVAVSGCVDQADSNTESNGENEDTDVGPFLDAPDPQIDPANVDFPVYGEELPDVTMTEVLRGQEMSTAGFDKISMFTFIYGFCQSVCPRLTSTLQNIQTEAIESDFGDEMAFVETTFDPERDTPEHLEQHAETYNVNLDANNWYMMRPESPERAKEVVQDTFGVTFVKTHPENMDMYMFDHTGLIILANKHGVVERSYLNTRPVWQDIFDEVETLVEKHP